MRQNLCMKDCVAPFVEQLQAKKYIYIIKLQKEKIIIIIIIINHFFFVGIMQYFRILQIVFRSKKLIKANYKPSKMKVLKYTFGQSFKLHNYRGKKTKNTQARAQTHTYSHVHINTRTRIRICKHTHTHI